MRWRLYRNLVPNNNSQGTLELRHFIDAGAVLFDCDDKYPIWDEDHRAELEKKIIDHYYNQQIGFETFGRFKRELNVRMREIMPYYCKLYDTTTYKYNPIENYNMKEEFIDSGDSNVTGKSKTENKYSDTPQNEVSNIDKYLTNHAVSDDASEQKSKTENVHTGSRVGNIGVTSTQQLIEQERNIILNIDVQIIERLQDLFLGVL